MTGALASAAVSAVSGAYAAAEVATTGGLDYTGLAAVITAISGMIATVGALIIGLRKKNTDVAEIIAALEESRKKMDGGQA